ncbi:Guanosine-diphosphatase [Coemansia sp. RSA 2131]|nr:Guanosine-diphosphatase [Coemansia sp. RSA 2131]
MSRGIQRRNTQSRDATPHTPDSATPIELSETPTNAQTSKDSTSIELNMFREGSEALGLGQYPATRRFSRRATLRLFGLIIGVLTLGYFGLGMLRAPTDMSTPLDARLLSKHCTLAHPGKPLIQYVLMVDAGSTGSRIHVYKFNYCKEQPELEDEIFEQIKPGLSSFKNDSMSAARSLDGLMNAALRGVPHNLHACTPVAVKATAGLRMLGATQSDAILQAVEDRLRTEYPFRLVRDAPVEIMDGTREGVFAWVTVNYLLGTLGQQEHKTAATFDLGGGSTQLVFEPRFNHTELEKGEHRYDVQFGGQSYALYQHSYLGYGLMEARKTFKRRVADAAFEQGKFSVSHACFPPGYREEITDPKSATITGATKQNPRACYTEVLKLFDTSAACVQAPCTFNGVYQPSLKETFADNPFYIFSYFYDRTYPLNVRDEFSLDAVQKLMDRVCSFDWHGFTEDEQKELEEESHYCMDLSFQYALLVDGVGVDANRTVRSTRKINDAETGWCLGASLAILEEQAYCKK